MGIVNTFKAMLEDKGTASALAKLSGDTPSPNKVTPGYVSGLDKYKALYNQATQSNVDLTKLKNARGEPYKNNTQGLKEASTKLEKLLAGSDEPKVIEVIQGEKPLTTRQKAAINKESRANKKLLKQEADALALEEKTRKAIEAKAAKEAENALELERWETAKRYKEDTNTYNKLNQSIFENKQAFNNKYVKSMHNGSLSDIGLDQLTKWSDNIAAYEDKLDELLDGGYMPPHDTKWSPDIPRFELPEGALNRSSYVPYKPKPVDPSLNPDLDASKDPLDMGAGYDGAYTNQNSKRKFRKDPDSKPTEPIDNGYKPEDYDETVRRQKANQEAQNKAVDETLGNAYSSATMESMSRANRTTFEKFAKLTESVAEGLGAIVGDETASRLLSFSRYGTGGNSAAIHTKNFVSRGKFRLNKMFDMIGVQADVKLADVLLKMVGQGGRYAAKRAVTKQLYKDVAQRLFINSQEFASGQKISKSPNKAIQDIVDAYATSGFVDGNLQDLKKVGLAQDVLINPYSLPVVHQYKLMKDLVADGTLTWEQLHAALGKQILNNPGIANVRKDPVDPRVVGKAYVEKLHSATQNKSNMHWSPPSSGDRIIDEFLDKSLTGKGDVDSPINWDFKEAIGTTANGKTITMADLVDTNIRDLLINRNARQGGLFGLANSGLKVKAEFGELTDAQKAENALLQAEGKPLKDFYVSVNSEARLDRFFKTYLDEIDDPALHYKAKEFLKNYTHTQMGRATGETLPPVFSSSITLATTMLLKNSGIYNLVDFGTMMYNHGGLKVLPALLATLGSGDFMRIVGNRVTPDEARKGLEHILAMHRAGDNGISSYAHFMADDAYDGSALMASIDYLGQGTPFANMSEMVRRTQLYTVARLLDDELKAFGKGNSGGRKSIAGHWEKAGVPPEIVAGWKEAINKYGTNIDAWDAKYNPQRFQGEISNLMDRSVFSATHGELPSWFANSTVAKTIFPFMTAQFALGDKLLKQTIALDGKRGLAELIAYQTPFALAAVYLKEIAAGRDPSELSSTELIFGYLNSIPTLGQFSLLLNLVNPDSFGLNANSTVLTAVDKLYTIAEKTATGEASWADFVAHIPLAGLVPPVNAITGQFKGE